MSLLEVFRSLQFLDVYIKRHEQTIRRRGCMSVEVWALPSPEQARQIMAPAISRVTEFKHAIIRVIARLEDPIYVATPYSCLEPPSICHSELIASG